MSKKCEIIAQIEGLLVKAGLSYTTTYMPDGEAYSIYISDEEPEVEHRCKTCKWWGGPDKLRCHNCVEADNWEPETPEKKYNPVQKAYNMLVNARDNGSTVDADDLIGYLGEALDE